MRLCGLPTTHGARPHMPDALGEFEGFESMHAGRPPVGVALIGRSGMRQMRGEEMSDYLPSTEEVLDPYIWLMGR